MIIGMMCRYFLELYLFIAGQKCFSIWTSWCLQASSLQSEDCDDSSVVDPCGFVKDNVAGESYNRQTGDNSSVNSIPSV